MGSSARLRLPTINPEATFMLTRIATLLLLSLFLSPCMAQELWRGAREQMTLEQVQELFPEARKPADPEELVGSVELLRVDSVDLYGRKFDAGFYFKRKKLAVVKLRPLGEMTEIDSFGLFDTIRDEQYGINGEPRRKDEKILEENGVRSAFRVNIWNTRTGRVVLVVLAIDGKKSFMHLVFDSD